MEKKKASPLEPGRIRVPAHRLIHSGHLDLSDFMEVLPGHRIRGIGGGGGAVRWGDPGAVGHGNWEISWSEKGIGTCRLVVFDRGEG